MVRIKIVQAGWEGFSSNLGTTVFEDGIAECSELEANRIGATIQIVRLNDDDEDDGVVNISHEITKIKGVSAEVAPRLRTTAERLEEEPETEGEVEGSEEETEDDETEATIYTEEQLQEIADESGIRGLREISDPLGVKSTKIAELIQKILEAQDAA
jgi:hypothetical protein